MIGGILKVVKIIAVFIFVILIGLIVVAMCKVAKRGDKTLERPDRITIRGDRLR